jgi:hypothetical protein
MTATKRRPLRPKHPKLTDAERYKRFLDAAKEVGASEDPKDFERAFGAVIGAGPSLVTKRRP